MPRTLSTGFSAAISAQRSRVVHLVSISSTAGTSYLTNAAQNIVWNGSTWTAIGGLLQTQGTGETGDIRAQSVAISLSGVDQTVISTLLNHNLRGQVCDIYRAHLSTSWEVVVDPMLEFRGWMNDQWTITESRDPLLAGSVELNFRAVSRLALLDRKKSVRTNEQSHNDMLRRAGSTDLTDDAMKFVQNLQDKPIYWGTKAPQGTGTWDDPGVDDNAGGDGDWGG